MRNYITEVVGSFIFVFSIALAAVHAGPLAPLVFGAALMCVVYMGAHISGAHYNPAVTLAVFLRGRITGSRALGYVIAQFAGSTAAAALAGRVTHRAFVVAPPADFDVVAALLVEAIFTYALTLVVLNVATDDAVERNSFYGLAIGFTAAVGAFAAGPISGGAFNPAVGLGAAWAAIGSAPAVHTWLYLVGPFCGAVFAALTYHLQHPRSAGR